MPLVYLDTSVASAYFDERDSQRMLLTKQFWSRVSTSSVLISDLVIREIRQILDQRRREAIEGLLRQFEVALVDDETHGLAQQYLDAGVFAASSRDDALHVAVAVVAGADVIVSWNFQHLVKARTVQRVNGVNLSLGYRSIDIRSPLEM